MLFDVAIRVMLARGVVVIVFIVAPAAFEDVFVISVVVIM